MTARRLLLVGALALGLLVALNWQGVMLAFAITTGETRPSLLADAEWNKPQSAVGFNRRFRAGSQESDLLAWLQNNGFATDRDNRSASRTVKSLPCNETVEVTWRAASSGALNGAQATVKEAGCL